MTASVTVITLYSTFVLQLCTGSLWSLLSHRTKRGTCNSDDFFACTSGQCVPWFIVCDGSKDCRDGSDETKDICESLNIKCPTDSFKCTYGACIDGHKICNQRNDCADASDEDRKICLTPANATSAQGNCKNNEFECDSGDCISEFSRCDGVANCNDGTDETEKACMDIGECYSNSYKCKYGACIDNFKLCDGRRDCADGSDEGVSACSKLTTKKGQGQPPVAPPLPTPIFLPEAGGCVLPEPPVNGHYISMLCSNEDTSPACREVPGTKVNRNWQLQFECKPGYELPTNVHYAICVNGDWSPFVPKCIKLCKSLVSMSVQITCYHKGYVVNCSQPMMPGTKANGTCNINYNRNFFPSYPEIICEETGNWNEPMFYCTPDCGRPNTDIAVPTIQHGFISKHGEFPWYAGLYVKDIFGNWVHNCGGTLINPHIILTAAHCVYNETSLTKFGTHELKVSLGKYYIEWNKHEPKSFKLDVREIVIPDLYESDRSSYAQDIALIDLTSSVPITNLVMPACVDWEQKFKIQPNMLGSLAGFGLTARNEPSYVMMTAKLPVIRRQDCRNEFPQKAQRFLTSDKFCAGYKNGTTIKHGDSGSGLTFDNLNGLHMVYGIVSLTIKQQDTYALFTNISDIYHFNFIKDHTQRFKKAHVHEY